MSNIKIAILLLLYYFVLLIPEINRLSFISNVTIVQLEIILNLPFVPPS